MLLAAGRGTRFGGTLPKAYLPLGGATVLEHAAWRLCRAIAPTQGNRLVILVHPDDATHLAKCRAGLLALGDVRFAMGGATRQESMRNGLAAAGDDAQLILVHDAARAMVPIAAVRECVRAAAQHGAALLGIPTPDTLKLTANGMVVRTVPRDGIWQAQTPQVMRRELLERAFAHAEQTGFLGTDDVSLIEHFGAPVAMVRGAATNLKITQPEDLPLAERILATLA